MKINDTLIEIQSNALGDTIGAMAVIEKYRKVTGKKITVICNHVKLFKSSYSEIELIDKSNKHEINNREFIEKVSTTYKFNHPLLKGYANDFGINDEDIVLKVDRVRKERPIKGKYVCIGVHSTAQCKYWNYPDAWNELCKLLRKKGLTPVCVERDWTFGIPGHMNEVPNKSVKKIGMNFDDVINHIQHAELFIGLSSGLSWLAQGLGIPTVIISNVTSKDNEYIDDKTLRIYDESVCHGCFHKYTFDAGDWLWCPVYRNDEIRRFICTKAITPEFVIREIEKFYNI